MPLLYIRRCIPSDEIVVGSGVQFIAGDEVFPVGDVVEVFPVGDVVEVFPVGDVVATVVSSAIVVVSKTEDL